MSPKSQKQWQFLQRSFELGRIAHAYLFYGGTSPEKKKIALEFIKLINCQSDKKPCGSCRNCLDIEKNVSPDFFFIEPIEGEIKIAQIRDLHSKMSLRSYSSPFKSVLIDQAHNLNWEAQSAFLKLLEEPKGKTIFILSTDYPERLLPTIISRTERFRLYSSTEKPSFNSEEKQSISEILSLSDKSLSERFSYAKKLTEGSKDVKEILPVWLSYFREQLLETVKGKKADFSAEKLKRITNSIWNTHILMSTTNVNSRLALEILMLEL
jgi:DNA polymerase-3 subunit delta'